MTLQTGMPRLSRPSAHSANRTQSPAQLMQKKAVAWIGGAALAAGIVAMGVWLYPELRRYLHVKKM